MDNINQDQPSKPKRSFLPLIVILIICLLVGIGFTVACYVVQIKSNPERVAGYQQFYPIQEKFEDMEWYLDWINVKNPQDKKLGSKLTLIANISYYDQGFTKNLLPVLADIDNQYRLRDNEKKDFRMIGINVNQPWNNERINMDDFNLSMVQKGISFPVAVDESQRKTGYPQYQEQSSGDIPNVMLVDANKNIRYYGQGATNYDEIYNAIDYLLQEKDPETVQLKELGEKYKDKSLELTLNEDPSVKNFKYTGMYMSQGTFLFLFYDFDSEKPDSSYEDSTVILAKTSLGRLVVGYEYDKTYCRFFSHFTDYEKTVLFKEESAKCNPK